MFVIGTPTKMVSDYLICIGTLARLLKNSDLRDDLMRAPTAIRIVEILKSAASAAR
jgi:mannitol/fructose-specific phosphotransferase system IIA component (Ntr-type)